MCVIEMNHEEKFELIIKIIIGVAFLGFLLGWSQGMIDKVIDWLMAVAISVVLSGVAGGLIEGFTGDFFKTISLNIPVGKFNISISVFLILTLILKFTLFK